MELIFVGTGVSTAIPVMGHLSKGCACYDAINTPNSKNMRNNVSVLLRKIPDAAALQAIGEPPENSLHNAVWQKKRSEVECNILIDCGKTFRSAYFRVLAKLGISVISAVLITHEHADAAAGLDDLRDLIPIENTGPALEVYQALTPCPIYMTLFTLKSLARTVGYILRYSRFLNAVRKEGLPHAHAQSPDMIADYDFQIDGPRGIPKDAESYQKLIANTPVLGTTERRVTSLDVIVLPEAVQQFYVKGLAFPMYSFPVFHGGDYICTAYAFGSKLKVRDPTTTRSTSAAAGNSGGNAPPFDLAKEIFRSVVYLSDVSSIGPDTMNFLLSLEPVDLLVVDLLLGPNAQHFSHWCYDDVVKITTRLRPKAVLGVGMWCTVEHKDTNAQLAQSLAEMQKQEGEASCRTQYMGLAYDGLTLKIE